MEVLSILKPWLANTSVVFAIAGSIIYMIALYVGHRPAWSSFVAWFFIGTTGFWFHLETIATDETSLSAYLPATFAFIPLMYIIFLYLLKAEWKLETRDIWCLAAAAVCWMVWVVTHAIFGKAETSVAVIPMMVLVMTDTFSSWPILKSAVAGHENNKLNQWSWGLTAISTICGLGAVGNFASGEIIYPLYLFGMMSTIAFFSLRQKTIVPILT